jgi:hypothetical protein
VTDFPAGHFTLRDVYSHGRAEAAITKKIARRDFVLKNHSLRHVFLGTMPSAMPGQGSTQPGVQNLTGQQQGEYRRRKQIPRSSGKKNYRFIRDARMVLNSGNR